MWSLTVEPEFPDFAYKPACPSSPESLTSSDFSGVVPTWDEEDFTGSVKYDQLEFEKNPELFTLISPVSFKPVPLASVSASPEPETDLELPAEDANLTDVNGCIPWELYLPNCLDDFSDDFINDIAKVDINSTIFEDPLENSSNSDCDDKDSSNVDLEVPVQSVRTSFHKPYHLDFDHCYSAPPKVEVKHVKKVNYWEVAPYSPYSSETSSEEVDVVTVTEEPSPIVPKVVSVQKAPPRKRGRKSVKKTAKPAPAPPTAKALKAAVRNNRITSVRRANTKKSRKISLETPSPSISSHSSRCNSDAEETGKRANHNISERKRREILKNSLQNLRKSVPSTQHNLKAAKVTILNAAAKYVCELKQKETELMKLKRVEEQKHRQRDAYLKVLLQQVKQQVKRQNC